MRALCNQLNEMHNRSKGRSWGDNLKEIRRLIEETDKFRRNLYDPDTESVLKGNASLSESV